MFPATLQPHILALDFALFRPVSYLVTLPNNLINFDFNGKEKVRQIGFIFEKDFVEVCELDWNGLSKVDIFSPNRK